MNDSIVKREAAIRTQACFAVGMEVVWKLYFQTGKHPYIYCEAGAESRKSFVTLPCTTYTTYNPQLTAILHCILVEKKYSRFQLQNRKPEPAVEHAAKRNRKTPGSKEVTLIRLHRCTKYQESPNKNLKFLIIFRIFGPCSHKTSPYSMNVLYLVLRCYRRPGHASLT